MISNRIWSTGHSGAPHQRKGRELAKGTEHQTTETRLTDLEVRYSYLERTVAELDEVVIGLRSEVDKLRRELVTVQAEVKESPTEAPPNEKPPHY
jgi:SlyX protein